MARMEKKTLDRPDEVRAFDRGRVEVVTLGGVTFGRATFQPGWRWSTHVKPVAGTESCEAPHLQYHVPAVSACAWTTAAKTSSAPATSRCCRPATTPGSSATSRSS